MHQYDITLINEDGNVIGKGTVPVPTRFVHVRDTDAELSVELSDSPEPMIRDQHLDSFARLGSAVWTDNGRSALYLRVTT